MSDVISLPDPSEVAALFANRPALRVREAAAELGVPEAALVAALPGAVRLRADWPSLLEGLAEAGEVMALTRNDHAVHERHGIYRKPEIRGDVGCVLGPEIDLRLFFARWAHAWFVPAGLPGSPRGSIQVFDRTGAAVHKVFATEATRHDALVALAEHLASPDPPPQFQPPPSPRADPVEEAIEVATLRSDWLALGDTDDFGKLLRKPRIGRAQAFRLAGEELARPVAPLAVRRALEGAASGRLPIRVIVPNAGTIQIHTGTVERLKETGAWFNVLDPRFNLHLHMPGLARAWLVRKPTAEGLVTSIEAFGPDDTPAVLLFGTHDPGGGEDDRWRALAEHAAEASPC